MPRFAANLTMMFTEMPFLDRFEAAAACGFKAVEFLFPYDWPISEVKSALEGAGLSALLINTPPGDWGAGERGLAALPGRESDFHKGLELALEYAGALGVVMLHVMSGVLPADCERAKATQIFQKNLSLAAEMAGDRSIDILIEPINNIDVPGYFLADSRLACRVIESLDLHNLHLQLDIYHLHVAEGNLTQRICELLHHVRHIQISGCPGRHEPDGHQEIDYPYVFGMLDRQGYDGWISCEYHPRGNTRDGLAWARGFGLG